MASMIYNYPITGVRRLIDKLNGSEHLVHADIMGEDMFEELLKLGFHPESWERINHNNKILVNGVHYKDNEYLHNKFKEIWQ